MIRIICLEYNLEYNRIHMPCLLNFYNLHVGRWESCSLEYFEIPKNLNYAFLIHDITLLLDFFLWSALSNQFINIGRIYISNILFYFDPWFDRTWLRQVRLAYHNQLEFQTIPGSFNPSYLILLEFLFFDFWFLSWLL